MKSRRMLADLALHSSRPKSSVGKYLDLAVILQYFRLSTLVATIFAGFGPTSGTCFLQHAVAQDTTALPEGLHRVESGQHLIVITDLPVDDEIRQLPLMFDQAMPFWCDLLSVPTGQTKTWRVTLYLMLDRQRFRESGLITDEIPEFQHGWQSGDKIWVHEQPSSYYRRHLMLHEGTHWFMQRKYGRYHAPWLMEGLAEWVGTHRIQNAALQLGVIPNNKQEVPFWGRITLIQQQLKEGSTPSMEEIWLYSNSAHQRVDAYAWSWAMVLFLKNHPSTSKLMSALLKQPAMDTQEMNRWLRTRLRGKLPQLRAEWGAFVAELDYGYTPEPGMLCLSEETAQLSSEATVAIDAHKGWQATGIKIEAGQIIEVIAEGKTVLAVEPKPWLSHPDGLTLEYYRGQPIGKLMMAIVGPLEVEGKTTRVPEVIPVGSRAIVASKTNGEVFFRVNEATAELKDNTGRISIKIRSVSPRPTER